MTGEQKNSFVSALTTTMMLPHILPNNFDAFQKNLKRHTQFHISDEVAKCRSNKCYRVNNNSVKTKFSEVLNSLHAQSMKSRKRNTPAFRTFTLVQLFKRTLQGRDPTRLRGKLFRIKFGKTAILQPRFLKRMERGISASLIPNTAVNS